MSKKNIELKLSDIIKIISPKNDILNDKTFIIDYIDKNKIVLLGEDSLEEIILTIHSNGQIGDGTIKQIEILKRNPLNGYSRQNNLLPGSWVNITFGGDSPFILIGEITNLEEDMIEVKTYPDNETLYFNFAYQGIPEDLPIQSIEIRNPPEDIIPVNIQEDLSLKPEENIIPSETESQLIDRDINEDLEIEDEPELDQEILKKNILEADEVVFGEYLDPVKEFNIIEKDKYRFDIQVQSNDILDNLLSKIPMSKRSDRMLDMIHLEITRFLQLRKEFSILDTNGNIIGYIKKDAKYKPLSTYLNTLNNNLQWIYFITNTKKKIYIDDVDNYPKDILPERLLTSLQQIEDKFIDYKNGSMEFDSNYAHLYNSIMGEMNPYLYSEQENIFEGQIQSNLIGLTNNLDNMKSSTFSKLYKNNFFEKKFFIQQYNIGLNISVSDSFKGSQYNPYLKKLTPNDNIEITGLLSLPEPFVRYSKIKLPNTSIIHKSNLNLIPFQLSKFLNRKQMYQNIDITDLETDFDYQDNNFLNNIKKFNLELAPQNELSKEEIFTKYLNIIFPKTKVLFNLMKSFMIGNLSIVSILDYLEPFKIYSEDLTFKQYRIFNYFINDKIAHYNKNFIVKRRLLSNLTSVNKVKFNTNILFLSLISLELRSLLLDYYDIPTLQNTQVNNNDNILCKILRIDQGRFFNECISFSNLSLLVADGVVNQLDAAEQQLIKKQDSNLEKNNCNSNSAKIYNNEKELDDDNDQTIFYDKSLDKTDYTILERFKKERYSKDFNTFLSFLTEQIKILYPKIKDPQYLAETLAVGQKEVREGDFAFNSNTRQTYERANGKWVLNYTDVSPQFNADTLCLIKERCVNNNGMIESIEPSSCISTTIMKEQILLNDITAMLDNFDTNYKYSQSKLKREIESKMKYLAESIHSLKYYESYKFLTYNYQQYNLGLLKDKEKGISSPYSDLFSKILSVSDFVKRQNLIIDFSEKFSRAFYPDTINLIYEKEESKYWRYCIKTNAELVPTFLLELAKAFFNDRDKYDLAMDKIISNQGVLGDDGDRWIDEYTGYTIKTINLVEEEEYDEGFKIKSRDVLEEDQFKLQGTDLTLTEPQNLNPLSQIIYSILNSLGMNSFINISSEFGNIINITTSLILNPSILETEEQYKNRQNKSSKKMPPYEMIFNSTLLFLTTGLFIIYAQCSIPSVKLKRTFPGCVASLKGFPLVPNGDNTTLIYFSCILFNIKTPEAPWNVIKSQKIETISEKLKFFITKFLLANGDIQVLLEKKILYLNSLSEVEIEDEIYSRKWTNFRPPLREFHIKTISPLADNFKDQILDDIKKASYKQDEKIRVMQSKQIFYSLYIVQLVQKIVSKKSLLLTGGGNPYVENSCCNDSELGESVLQYFINQSQEIENINKIVSSLGDFINMFYQFSKASMIISSEDTKRRYPPIPEQFSEETMLKVLILYCNYNNLIPIPTYLLEVCQEKPNFISTNEKTNQIIEKMKNQSFEFSKAKFNQILQRISMQNKLNINLQINYQSSYEIERQYFEEFNENYHFLIPEHFIKLIKDSLDTYDPTTSNQQVRELRNFLVKHNESSLSEINEFISSQSEFSSRDLTKVTDFLKSINNWNGQEAENIDNEAFVNYIQFYKNACMFLNNVIPKLILTKTMHILNCPKYWKLSARHIKDLDLSVSDYYDNYYKFFDSLYLTPVLQSILQISHVFNSLIQKLVFYLPIDSNNENTNLFDKRSCVLLLNFYFLQSLKAYIYYSTKSKITTSVNLLLPVSDEDNSLGEMFFGEKKMIKTEVAKLLGTYIKTLITEKSNIDNTKQSIKTMVFRLSQAEKNTFTERLENMSPEERDAENILKLNKLGVWNKGLLKGLKEYDPENYDQERELMYKISRVERNVRENNEEFREQNLDTELENAIDEQMNEQEVDDRVFQEERNIRNLNSNFWDGDVDNDDVDLDFDYEEY